MPCHVCDLALTVIRPPPPGDETLCHLGFSGSALCASPRRCTSMASPRDTGTILKNMWLGDRVTQPEAGWGIHPGWGGLSHQSACITSLVAASASGECGSLVCVCLKGRREGSDISFHPPLLWLSRRLPVSAELLAMEESCRADSRGCAVSMRTHPCYPLKTGRRPAEMHEREPPSPTPQKSTEILAFTQHLWNTRGILCGKSFFFFFEV